MKYENVVKGIFRERPNRFIAMVELNGKVEKCHVKNTGRCREILIPGAEVYLLDSEGNTRAGDVNGLSERKGGSGSGRKTRYDVIAVKKKNQIVNIDSQIPNKAVAEWLRAGNLFSKHALIKAEQKYGDSRFDLYVEDRERKAFIEVKGVTLEMDGIARFPDAPTERGVKHVKELCRCMEDGYEAYLFFLIQMKGVYRFEPNWSTHEAFGMVLRDAHMKGVKLMAYDSLVKADSICVDRPIEINLA